MDYKQNFVLGGTSQNKNSIETKEECLIYRCPKKGKLTLWYTGMLTFELFIVEKDGGFGIISGIPVIVLGTFFNKLPRSRAIEI